MELLLPFHMRDPGQGGVCHSHSLLIDVTRQSGRALWRNRNQQSIIYLDFVVHSQFSSPLSTPRRWISFDENSSHMSNNPFPIKRAPRCQLLRVFPRRRLRFRLECRAKSFQHRSDKRNAHMGLSSTFFVLSP